MILIGRAAYVAIVFIFLLVVSVRVPWQTRSADWLVLGTRTMTVTLTRREGRRTPSLLRYSLELVAQFVNEIMSDSRASRAGALLFASCVLKRTPVDSESWLPFVWEHATSIGILDRVQPVL